MEGECAFTVHFSEWDKYEGGLSSTGLKLEENRINSVFFLHVCISLQWIPLEVVFKLSFGLKLSLCGSDLFTVMSAVWLSWQGRLHCVLWFKTNGGNEKTGTSADWNHIRSQSKCKLARDILLIKSKCDHFDSGGQTSKKMFLELYLGHCGFGGRPETRRMCVSSSGRYFLILKGCWLLAFVYLGRN